MEPPRPCLRVRSIPSSHPYVRQALPVDAVEVLDDPTTPWWPPLALDVEWFEAHGQGTDVVHLHFGFEHLALNDLRRWCRSLTLMRIPLVVTVHDLRNPHLADNVVHEAQLAVLLARADAVITLTDGAARRLRDQYGARAAVLAHPAMIDPDRPCHDASTSRADPGDPHHLAPVARAAPVVGIHLGTGRANLIDPADLVGPVADGARAAGASLTVCVRREAGRLCSSVERVTRLHGADMIVDDGELSDDELHARLLGWRVAVLPYRFGSHSGWVELCHDLGVRVVAPDCGFYAEQWSEVRTFGCNEEIGLLPGSVHDAVVDALSATAPCAADPAWRRVQRDAVRRAHRSIYEAVRRSGARDASAQAS